ncbi:MAG: pyruvate kinase, partial [Candidatus Phytoplasma australasiaticum]|nr:pyruvate kinase [Candidatus Phytoplasma australasiaticum]
TMLSGESASGNYPIESVQYMYNINKSAEKFLDYDVFLNYWATGFSAALIRLGLVVHTASTCRSK